MEGCKSFLFEWGEKWDGIKCSLYKFIFIPLLHYKKIKIRMVYKEKKCYNMQVEKKKKKTYDTKFREMGMDR